MPERQTIEEAVRQELVNLWIDLDNARDTAIRGHWSMKCDFLVDRIKTLTVHVGPTPQEDVPASLVKSGIYQRVIEDASRSEGTPMAGREETTDLTVRLKIAPGADEGPIASALIAAAESVSGVLAVWSVEY